MARRKMSFFRRPAVRTALAAALVFIVAGVSAYAGYHIGRAMFQADCAVRVLSLGGGFERAQIICQ